MQGVSPVRSVFPCHQKMFIWSCKIRCWNSCPMPQVIQMEICPWLFGTFEKLLESWLDFPITAGHHDMPLDYERPIIGMFFHLRWFCLLRGFLFIECPSCEFLYCWTNSHIKMLYQKIFPLILLNTCPLRSLICSRLPRIGLDKLSPKAVYLKLGFPFFI